MELFRGQNLIEFSKRIKTDEDCKEYLAKIKWEKGYECIKRGYSFYQIRKDYSRTCNKCSHTDTTSANTSFHMVKFGIRKAFFICFEMSTTTKSLSASHVGVRFGVTEKRARLFMQKIREAVKSSKKHPMKSEIHVDEFVLGGKVKGKVGHSHDSKNESYLCCRTH